MPAATMEEVRRLAVNAPRQKLRLEPTHEFQEHGVLTYALLEAMNKKDDIARDDDRISVGALAGHVVERMPEITLSLTGVYQTPLRRLSGDDFPIGVRQPVLAPVATSTSTAGKDFYLRRDERVRETPDDAALGSRILGSAAPPACWSRSRLDRGTCAIARTKRCRHAICRCRGRTRRICRALCAE
jgi:hypothetical protein